MNHYNIDKCTCDYKYCSLNIDSFIFYHNLEFFLITSNPCLMLSNLDKKQDIIQQLLDAKDKDIHHIYEDCGRTCLDESLKEYRLRNLSIERNIVEVNMSYPVVGRGIKCLSTTLKYSELALNQDVLDKNYLKAEKYLKDNGYNYLLEELNQLYSYNRIYEGFNIEVQKVRSIDKLIKTIKDEINTESKHHNAI